MSYAVSASGVPLTRVLVVAASKTCSLAEIPSNHNAYDYIEIGIPDEDSGMTFPMGPYITRRFQDQCLVQQKTENCI